MRKVDFFGLAVEHIDPAARVIVAFLESLERGCCLAFEAEGGGDFVPVELHGGGALGELLAA